MIQVQQEEEAQGQSWQKEGEDQKRQGEEEEGH